MSLAKSEVLVVLVCCLNNVSGEIKGPAFCACGIFAFGAEAKIRSVETPGLFRRIQDSER